MVHSSYLLGRHICDYFVLVRDLINCPNGYRNPADSPRVFFVASPSPGTEMRSINRDPVRESKRSEFVSAEWKESVHPPQSP